VFTGGATFFDSVQLISTANRDADADLVSILGVISRTNQPTKQKATPVRLVWPFLCWFASEKSATTLPPTASASDKINQAEERQGGWLGSSNSRE